MMTEKTYLMVKVLVRWFVFCYFYLFIYLFIYLFVCVCDVNFEEIILFSVTLNPWLVPFRSYEISIILQLITVAVRKHLSIKNRIIMKSVNWFAKQSIGWFLCDASFYCGVFPNRQAIQVFFKNMPFLKKQSNIDSVGRSSSLTLQFHHTVYLLG